MRRGVVALFVGALVLSGAGWWWLREAGSPPQATPLQRDGSTMEKFALVETQRSQTRWKILADMAWVNPKLDTTTIERVHFTLFSARHGQVEVTGRRGVIQNQSKNMQICGDVQLSVGQDFSLITECLRWSVSEQVLETDAPVTVRMGNLRAEGRGFRGSVAEERFEIPEQVQARWEEP
ncbi:MAG: LPS export ABC transporter periplasmic protein LptC [Candidatus Entotheonellia bacterium]